MLNISEDNQLKRLIVVGDRVLIKPKNPADTTPTGLFLPPSVADREQVQTGFVVKVGPGYPLPSNQDDEPWKETAEKVKYMPLQAEEGDVAIYLHKSAIEVTYQNEKFVIVPQSSILLLERLENIFE